MEPKEPNAGGAAAAGPSQPPAASATSSTPSGKPPEAASKKPPTKAPKKRKQVVSRKPSANKQAGIQTRRRSPAWDHFKRVLDEKVSEPTAECIYCGIRFLCGSKDHGTSNMLGHIPKCPKSLNVLNNVPNQKVLEFDRVSCGEQLVGSIPHTVDLKECRKGIAVFVICDEQPFKVVEGHGFKYMCKKLCPKLDVPSRHTMAKDCYNLYLEERDRLKALLKTDCVRVCLTIDYWTSLQNLNYMCLTAHFIDNEWKLQKCILNFQLIPNHKGETVGKSIEACLNDWGLKRVFTVTVDNTSSNDGAIAYLKRRVRNWNGLVLDGDMMHMRCCAHILNLVVNEGLKECHKSIASIKQAVRYVRSSPSNTVYNHLSLVQSEIKKWTSDDNLDSVLSFMANEMRIKYDKYWGRLENMNPIIFIANVLDPRYKLAYIAWSFEDIYGESLATTMVGSVQASMVRMYEWYSAEYGQPIGNGKDKQTRDGEAACARGPSLESHAQKARSAAFRSHLQKRGTIEAKNELERYLNEPCVDEDDSYDVLAW